MDLTLCLFQQARWVSTVFLSLSLVEKLLGTNRMVKVASLVAAASCLSLVVFVVAGAFTWLLIIVVAVVFDGSGLCMELHHDG
jgi:hypothetical protein